MHCDRRSSRNFQRPSFRRPPDPGCIRRPRASSYQAELHSAAPAAVYSAVVAGRQDRRHLRNTGQTGARPVRNSARWRKRGLGQRAARDVVAEHRWRVDCGGGVGAGARQGLARLIMTLPAGKRAGWLAGAPSA